MRLASHAVGDEQARLIEARVREGAAQRLTRLPAEGLNLGCGAWLTFPDDWPTFPRVDRTGYAGFLALLEGERAALLALLEQLEPVAWLASTACPGWSVKDIVAHILGDDFGILARERDGFRAQSASPSSTWDDVVRLVNEQNEAWVAAWRRMSPSLLRELLARSGPDLSRFYRTLDPDRLGGPVRWASDEPAPNWLRVAREYTERWVHQQQIRDAAGVPGLREARWVHPLLDTFAHSLPVALRNAAAPDGDVVVLEATGEGGGRWFVARREGRWVLEPDPGGRRTAATVTVDVETLWQLYTKAVPGDVARGRARVDGDGKLADAVLSAVAIIA